MSRFGGYMAVKEIGYMITPDHRGKGFASEAVTMMVDFLFLDKEWQRIQAIIAEENVASKRVLEKNGFQKEGVIRKAIFGLGRYWDVSLYSILREEWKSPKILPYTVK